MPRPYTPWSPYRLQYIRRRLEEGLSIALIADRLKVTPANLRAMIRYHRLREREAA